MIFMSTRMRRSRRPCECFGKAVKDATEGRKLVVCFYGYLFELASMPRGLQQSGHLATSRLLDSPNVDVLCAPISYARSRAGRNRGFYGPVDSVGLRGKLWANEDDTRTFRTGAGMVDYRRSLHVALMSYGQGAASAAETRAMHERNFAHVLTRGASCWWMDLMGEGWLDDVSTWKHLGRLKRVYDSLIGDACTYRPEIAVIVDEKSCFYLSQSPAPINPSLLRTMRSSLYRIGAPCGFYLLDDLVSGRIPDAKMTVFLNCFAMTHEERVAVRRQCAKDMCVFFYANGFIDETADVRNVEKLLGVPLKMSLKKMPGRVKPTEDPLVDGIVGFGTDDAISPVFVLDEKRVEKRPEVRVLGRYGEDGPSGAWIRDGKTFSSVYLGTLRCAGEVVA